MAGHEIKAKFTADTSSFKGGLKSVTKGVAKVGAIATGILAPLAAVAGAIGGIGLAIKSVDAAANFEVLTLQFETMLGSAEKARERMEELRKFAGSTPFALEGIAKASATLEGMTAGALSTGEGLRMVGDVAATAGTSIEEMAQIIGKLYQKLQAGKAAGESFDQLAERKGVLAGLRVELEAMQKQGAKGGDIWAKAKGGLMAYEGSMQKLSRTYQGLMSTLGDAWENLKVIFGTPIMESLKPIISEATGLLVSFESKAKEIGIAIGGAVSIIFTAFKQGKLWELAKRGLSTAFTFAGNTLIKSIIVAVKVFGKLLNADLSAMGEGLKKIFSNRDMLMGFKNLFKGLGLIIADSINSYFKSSTLLSGLATDADYQTEIDARFERAGYWLEGAGEQLGKGISEVAGELGKGAVEIKDIWDKQADVLNVSGSLKDFAKFAEGFKNPITAGALDPVKTAKAEADKGGTIGAIAEMITGKASSTKPVVGKLTRIGGDRGTSQNTLVNIQNRANLLLKQIAANTKNPTPVIP